MDERSEYEEIIKENLDYDILCQDPKFDKDRFREIMDIMLDAVCSTAPTIRINGEDEPINGLDPAGIVEVRNLLKSLNKEYGMTILVSSHILEELYQTATEFILIDKGKIIEKISDQELNERCKRHIAIKATDPQKALLVLEEKLHTENFKLMPDGTIRLYDYLDDLEKVAAVLSDAHILVTGLSVSGDTLEDYFLSKIGGSENVKSPKY